MIALFQALTQIQEMTLVFVPKILAIFPDYPCDAAVHEPACLQAFMGRVTEMILTTG